MPLRNRVDPFGQIFSRPERGMFMGNRGCLHDGDRNVIRDWKVKAWITCTSTWPGVRRTLMKPGFYTELFFLDEATALAAGHRPCGECRNKAYRQFKAAFATAASEDGHTISSVKEMDDLLHCGRMERPTATVDPGLLPDGGMVALDGEAWLKQANRLHRWTPAGYDQTRPAQGASARLLTPAPSIGAIRHGYVVEVHPTAGET